MVEKTNENKISIEEAKKLLSSGSEKEQTADIFDIYGNYNYPFETKLTTPNTAIGYVGDIY